MKQNVKVLIPRAEFDVIFNQLSKSRKCQNVWCAYSRTTCHVRELREGIRSWWNKTNGTAPGFSAYEEVFQNCIKVENRFYWMFWTHDMKPAEEVYREMITQIKLAFDRKPLDKNKLWGASYL